MKQKTLALWLGFFLLTAVVVGQQVEIHYLTARVQTLSDEERTLVREVSDLIVMIEERAR